ncbi:MAG: ATP-binding protein [Bryobacteraceae bacterium]
MPKPAKFQVDPRLAMLLGETYRSSEQAIKELVDNAWDADADTVTITLPDAMTAGPLTVKDDGSGMTEKEVRQEYLRIARDRRAVQGNRTVKKRLVKGRKGIGKFAGLMVADVMTLATTARGQKTTLTIPREELLHRTSDLEAFPIAVEVSEVPQHEHGTEVSLSRLHQNLAFPDPDKLRQLLVVEYGREHDFAIFVNGSRVSIVDVPGSAFSEQVDVAGVGRVALTTRLVDEGKGMRQPGIAIRVGGKVVGRPSFFGLEGADDIPSKLLRRVYGEVEADGLLDDVTADWGSVIENSKAYIALEQYVQQAVREQLKGAFQKEMNLAQARLQQEINRRLAAMPEHRREFARLSIERVIKKMYGESEERIRPIVSVVLDALELDEYWQVLERIDSAKQGDVAVLAEALHEFGVLEIGQISVHAKRRLAILDRLDEMVRSMDMKEMEVHKALETNLWVFGADFALMSSNRSLANIIADYTSTKFTGPRASKRPDLLLLGGFGQRYTLIEFKRPSHRIGREDLSQAEQYRDDLLGKVQPIDIVVIGGTTDLRLQNNMPPAARVFSYQALIGRARAELQWLVTELVKQPEEVA